MVFQDFKCFMWCSKTSKSAKASMYSFHVMFFFFVCENVRFLLGSRALDSIYSTPLYSKYNTTASKILTLVMCLSYVQYWWFTLYIY